MHASTRMLIVSTMTALVHAGFDLNSTSLLARDHPRDMLAKRSRDCGTFTMFCGGLPKIGGGRGRPVPEACANACFYINNFSPGFSTSWSSKTDNGRNREQAGCQKKAGSDQGTSVCNIAPFSQKLHDPLEEDSINPTRNCDEFPMAAMVQDDFGSGTLVRNTLACIDAQQNFAAGAQLNNFINGDGWYSQDESLNGGRSNECEGELKDGDTYKVAFNYEGDGDFDKSKIPFCKDDQGDLLKPENDDDTKYEFWMTKLVSDGSDIGVIDFPYNYNMNNRYADALTTFDVQQCKVTVIRNGDSKFDVEIIYGNGKETADSLDLPNDDSSGVVNAPDGVDYQPLKVQRTAPIGNAGGQGSQVKFFYGTDTKRFFEWASNSQGADDTLDNTRSRDQIPESVKGRYCLYTPVSDDKVQTITCWFPCVAPA